MLQTTRDRLAARRDADHGEGGFTLIELMVVVLIIAILLAIAVPTFLGAQNKAKDRSAQSSLRNTVTAAKTIYADNGNYSGATVAGLGAVEGGITYLANTAPSDEPKEVSVKVSADNATFYAAAWSKAGSCFYIKDTSAGSEYAKGTTCTADAAALATFGASW